MRLTSGLSLQGMMSAATKRAASSRCAWRSVALFDDFFAHLNQLWLEDCFNDLFNRDHYAYPGVNASRCAFFLRCNRAALFLRCKHVALFFVLANYVVLPNVKMTMDQTKQIQLNNSGRSICRFSRGVWNHIDEDGRAAQARD
jgi:hypothetical protein